jgi:hypothetical protein
VSSDQYRDLRSRVDSLRNQYSEYDRRRIRAVMNGGAKGVQAVLDWGQEGPEQDLRDLGVDLPTANYMHSGLERFAQKVGRPPSLKTDMLPTRDTDKARKKAEKRARIVQGWDDMSRMEMQYPQIGRWIAGYGFTVHVIAERKMGEFTYPVAELRDPYDCYPGFFGPDQQPTELAVIRRIPIETLRHIYPGLGSVKRQTTQGRGGAHILGRGQWEAGQYSSYNDVEVCEYMNPQGTWILSLDTEEIINFKPNPLTSGPAFVFTKRFSFDALQGQYQHVFGIMAMMAKLNLLAMIGAEESTFRETNVYGEMDSVEYEKGRDAINFFQSGSRVEKPTGEIINQTLQAINVLEREFRIVGAYDVQQDGISPNSFATGAGMDKLSGSADLNVREYQVAIRHSVELIDRKRLEWEETLHPNTEKRVYWYEGSSDFEETYIPSKDIAGDYRTERVFGAMATFDETSKILAGLQLVGARAMDMRTFQENIDGFRNISLINERIIQDQARDALLSSLGARSQQQDPVADMALVDILASPSEHINTLKKFFTPQEPQMSPEEMAMAQAQQMGMGGIPGGDPTGEGVGGPTSVQTILAQLEQGGSGAQTVSQI